MPDPTPSISPLQGKRVLFLAPHPFYQERGTPIAVDLLLKHFTEEGLLVDLVTFHEGEDRSYEGPGSVTFHRISRPPGCQGIQPGFSLKKLLSDVVLYQKASRLLKTNTYDMIHAVEEAAFLARHLSKRHRIPYIFDMDSSMSRQMLDKFALIKPLGPLMRWLEHRALRDATAVAAVCDDLAEIARSAGATSVFLLRDVPMIGETESVSEDLRKECGFTGLMILYVGNLESYQGIDLLLDSFAEMKGKVDASLVIVGGTQSHIDHYQDKARELKIHANTYFTGPKPLDQLGGLLSQADLLVSPRSQGTNTPMKLYSYMASGTAIVATDRLTHTQVLTPRTAALCAPTPTAYGEMLLTLLQDPERRSALAASALQDVSTTYSIENYRRTVQELLKEVLCDG